MAMTMNGEYELLVPPQTVWEKLNDAATLKACIPGCEQLDKTSDTEFQAVATVKIGPVKAKFKGRVTAGLPALPRPAPRSSSRRKRAGRCCLTMSMPRSAASWRSLASGWSTAPQRKSPTIFLQISPMR